jgi:hypothetical protein
MRNGSIRNCQKLILCMHLIVQNVFRDINELKHDSCLSIFYIFFLFYLYKILCCVFSFQCLDFTSFKIRPFIVLYCRIYDFKCYFF